MSNPRQGVGGPSTTVAYYLQSFTSEILEGIIGLYNVVEITIL